MVGDNTGDNMVGPVKFKNTPVEVCQFFLLGNHLCLKTPTGIQTIYHKYSSQKKTEQSMNETVSNWLLVGQDILKTFKKNARRINQIHLHHWVIRTSSTSKALNHQSQL